MSETAGTVYLVDDNPGMLRALARLVQTAQLNAVAFGSAQEFLDHGTPGRPACLVLDLRLPGLSGLDLQRELAHKNIDLPIIFLTGHGDVPSSVRAMKAGATDFLLKPFDNKDMLAAIRHALAKDHARTRAQDERGQIKHRIKSLTPRECQVFELVIRGLLNKQIANQLGATEQTIKVHRARVMHKLQVQSVAELVQAALKADVLCP